MRVVDLAKAFYHIYRHLPPELTTRAQERVRWLSCWQALRKQGLLGSEASYTRVLRGLRW